MMPGYLGPGSRRFRGSPGMTAEMIAKSVRLPKYVPVAQRPRRRLQIPFSGSSTLRRHTTPSARSPHALSSEAEHPAHIGKVGVSKSSARTSHRVRRVGKCACCGADGGQRRDGEFAHHGTPRLRAVAHPTRSARVPRVPVHRVLSSVGRAPPRHGGGRRIVTSRTHHSCPVAQRQSTRPITARPRLDTVRDNQHHAETVMRIARRPARLAAATRPGL